MVGTAQWVCHRDISVRASSDCTYKTCHNDILVVCIANYMIKTRLYDVILWEGFRSTKSVHNLTSDLCRFLLGMYVYIHTNIHIYLYMIDR